MQSDSFQAASGSHLTSLEYATGFVFMAPPEQFSQLRRLCCVRTRLGWDLPPTLQTLHLRVRRRVTSDYHNLKALTSA